MARSSISCGSVIIRLRSSRANSITKKGFPAVRPAMAPASGRVWPDLGLQQAGHVIIVEPFQPDPVCAVASQSGERHRQGLGCASAHGSTGAEQEDVRHRRLHDEGQQSRRRGVGPVQILEHDQQRLASTGLVQEPTHGVVAAQGRRTGLVELAFRGRTQQRLDLRRRVGRQEFPEHGQPRLVGRRHVGLVTTPDCDGDAVRGRV